MRKLLVITLMAVAWMLPSQHASAQYFNHLGLGVTVGIDGFGLELAAPLGGQFQVRAGYSMLPPMWKPHHVFELEETADHSMTSVDIEAIVKLGGGNLMFDWHPGGKAFFITAGAYAGARRILSIQNKEPFLDEEDWGSAGLKIGDIVVTTDDRGIAQANLKVLPVRPYLGIGVGNAIRADRRVCFNVELGACYTGGYKIMATGTNLQTGESGEVTATSAVLNNEDDGLVDKISAFPVLPLLKMGLYIRLF